MLLSQMGLRTMKQEIHPDYHDIVFLDTATGFKFLTRSTMTSKETVQWEDGNEYPLIKVDISSASHPYYTGKMKYVDSAGRVEKFQKKYNWENRKQQSKKKQEEKKNETPEEQPAESSES